MKIYSVPADSFILRNAARIINFIEMAEGGFREGNGYVVERSLFNEGELLAAATSIRVMLIHRGYKKIPRFNPRFHVHLNNWACIEDEAVQTCKVMIAALFDGLWHDRDDETDPVGF